MTYLFTIFFVVSVSKYLFEFFLERLNKRSYEDLDQQESACKKLKIDSASFQKTLIYTRDKSRFFTISNFLSLFILLLFIFWGGFGIVEGLAFKFSSSVDPSVQKMWFFNKSVVEGLCFFFIFFLLSTILSLPLEYYSTFIIEEKHGFNKQSPKSFFIDALKSLIVGLVLGGLLLTLLLKAMTLGSLWWLWAWVLLSLFSLLTSWIYPTLLAPIFNKFSPIEDKKLKESIFALAKKVSFKASGIFIMDASTRSTHGNAYFTGVFGKKRIVLFDTLVKDLNNNQIVAVLAHELGHFKLNHVRWGLVRSLAFTGLVFYLLSLCINLEAFYLAFGFSKVSNYAALVVFSLWFSLVSFLISPFMSFLSRRNEFAADAFAVTTINNSVDLGEALIKLSKSNHSMPISHPLYSLFYFSHPPLVERLEAINWGS